MEYLSGLWAKLPGGGLPATILLFLLLFVLRWLVLRYLGREQRISDELRARWQNFIKNAFVLAALIGLILIWAPQLRAFALSLTALAVASVLATKELILCVSGSLLKTSSSTFSVGDLVEYAGHRGYVVEQSLLTTQLQEVDTKSGVLSGNQIVLPNSLFLTHAVKNYSHLRPYCVHSFALFIEPAQANAVDMLVAALEKYATVTSKISFAEPEFERLPRWKRHLLRTSSTQVRVGSTETAKISFTTSFVCHPSRATEHQGNITRSFFQALAQYEKQKATAVEPVLDEVSEQ